MGISASIACRTAGLFLLALPAVSASAETAHYYGLYRATVVKNLDPLRQGRLVLIVPDVTGVQTTGWALPVLPYPYKPGQLKLPEVGQGVWVEFEQGNADYPVWVGGRP